MKKLYIFYHVYLDPYGNWRRIVKEQLECMRQSGIVQDAGCEVLFARAVTPTDITATEKLILGEEFLDFFRKHNNDSSNDSVIFRSHWSCGYSSDNQFEFGTLAALTNFALQHPDAYYLYIHTKGASYPSDKTADIENAARWRRYMMHHTVTRWRECVALLDGSLDGADDNSNGVTAVNTVDLVGPLWFRDAARKYAFFAGNFWWGRGEYLKDMQVTPELLNSDHRYVAEYFVSGFSGHTSARKPNVHCIDRPAGYDDIGSMITAWTDFGSK